MQCPSCGGRGCEHCTNGVVQITQCPKRYCGTIGRFLTYADLYRRGRPIAATCALDESNQFISAVAFYMNERAAMEAKHNPLSDGDG